MLGFFTFTFPLEFEKFEKVGAAAAALRISIRP